MLTVLARLTLRNTRNYRPYFGDSLVLHAVLGLPRKFDQIKCIVGQTLATQFRLKATVCIGTNRRDVILLA